MRTPYRPSPNAPFSHIQIVPKASSEECSIDEHSPQVIFRSPSYSKEAEEKMTAPTIAPSATASLANMTSGTTFAAKARAAELNAVRSRRAAKELETEDDVPSVTAMSLGALKFTKPRNRGRAWKALNLDDLPEGSEDDLEDLQRVHGSQRDMPRYVNDDTYTGNLATSGTLYPQSSSGDLAQLRADYDTRQWVPKMPPASVADHRMLSRRSSSQYTILSSRPSSALSHRFNQDETSGSITDQTVPMDGQLGIEPLGITGESKSTKMNVRNAADTDDPFTELPHKLRQSLFDLNPYGQSPSQGLGPSTTAHSQLSAASGSMNHEFRFSPAYHSQQPAFAQQYLGGPQQLIEGYQGANSKGQHIESVSVHQRDPMPYTGFAASSKKEQLLQTFNDAVESSKAEGSLPTSTRTVLYDPVTRDHQSQSYPSAGARPKDQTYPPATGPFAVPSDCDKDLLEASDPLPWKDRPVDVYNLSSPVDTDSNFARPGGWPTSQLLPPGLHPPENAYIWSLVPKPKASGRSFEDAEKWFRADARETQAIEAYLNGAATSQRATRVPERQAMESSQWSRTTTSAFVPEHGRDTGSLRHLMGPALANLQSYTERAAKPDVDYFGRFSAVPEWCIDRGPGGNVSFFGDWGVPPSRVGRDPRYRPTFHEGRYTVFEPMTRRGVRDGMVGGYH